MIIYIIMKLLLSYWLIIKKKWIKNQEKLFLFFDILVVTIYLIITYIKGFKLLIEILLFGLIIIIIFLLYKTINYIMENNLLILEKIKKKIGEKKQEKIKRFFLKPIVNKIIYYIIWMLPWNILYWIYFWVMENGWYARVWVSSTRDIILWKVFKWDSRDYFYNLLENKIRKNKWYQKIKIIIWKIQGMIYRIMYLIYLIRKIMIKTSIKKYIWIRIIVYMYLSMFYLYILMEIQYLNKILFYVLIIIEIIFLYYTKEIIEYYEKEYIEILKETNNLTKEKKWIITFLKYPFYTPYMHKWVKNKFIWDLTLSNSISLNILYKYILFVNKNTKGYFDKQMNIMTRVYREKYLERKSILWDVLPRTRYVIISLKNEEFYKDIIKGLDPDFLLVKYEYINLIHNKSLYLGYYEKTYSKTSLLMLIWILRINNFFWKQILRTIYKNDIYDFYKLKSFYLIDPGTIFLINTIMYIYIYKKDKRLINESILFEYLINNFMWYYNEEAYFYYFGENIYEKRNELPISNKICGIKNYKKMFKIMGRIMLYEEDSLNWNENLNQLLNEFNNVKNTNETVKKKYEEVFEDKLKNVDFNSLILHEDNFKILKEYIKLEIIKVNNNEIFDYNDFRYFFVKYLFTDEKLKIEKTYFEINNIKEEEMLDAIYYLLLKKHKIFSEHEFYNKGSNSVKFNVDQDYNITKEYKKL